MSAANHEVATADMADEEKYLVFRLSDELYASTLTTVREISKMGTITSVPFMSNYFKGIINLRGRIVSVVDLRMKFGLPVSNKNDGILIIIDTESGPIGIVVDDVVSVNVFGPESIEANLAIKTKIPVQFFLGVGKADDRLVNIVDLGGTLSADDFAAVRRATKQHAKPAA
jgi:purine-binding chemotaxis protein CheW